MRSLCTLVLVGIAAFATGLRAQPADRRSSYLSWSADEAKRIGRAMRVNGRVGGAFDLRVVHTERSYNYKLRATWLTKDVVLATARLLQLSERLTDAQTEELARQGLAAGDVVMMIEIDPREGSGIIPPDWSAFLSVAGNGRDAVTGVNTPALEKLKALRGVYARDYNYDVFWVVFPAERSAPMFSAGVSEATLTVRVSGKEGRVQFPIPRDYRP